MTRLELAEKYLKANGLRVLKGDAGNSCIFLPLLMMDAEYRIYERQVKALKCRFEANHWKKVWVKSYNDFSRQFFKAFDTADETEQIADMMDSFDKFITNKRVIVEVAILNAFRKTGVPEEQHDVLMSCLMCNLMAQAAQIVWKHSYVDTFGKPEINRHIDMVTRATMRVANYYHNSELRVNLNKYKDVVKSMEILCYEMVNWVNSDDQKQE